MAEPPNTVIGREPITEKEQSEKKQDETQSNKFNVDMLEKVFRWLNAAKTLASHNAAREQYLHGTGLWFKTSFENWKEGRQRYLWLEGSPGAGKTVLISSAITSLAQACKSNPDLVLAYYYFSFIEPIKATVDSMLGGLIAQIVAKRFSRGDGRAFDCLARLYEDFKHSQERPDTRRLCQMLREICATISGPIYVVLDALDECTGTRELLETVRTMKSSNMHLLVSSRSDIDIKETLQSEPKFVVVNMKESLVDLDIKAYVEMRLSESPKLQRFEEDIKDIIRAKVLSGSKGMFRLVYCQLQLLEQPHIICRETIEEVLNTLPTELNSMYTRILSQVDQKDRGDVRRVLTWIVAATRPLTVKEITGLLLMHSDDYKLNLNNSVPTQRPLDNILTIYGCLVRTQDDKGSNGDNAIVTLGHHSVAEYLLRLPIKGLEGSYFGLRMELADSEIFVTSLRLLPLIESVYSTNPLKEQGGRHTQLKSIESFIDYCAAEWLFHGMRSCAPAQNASTVALFYSLLPYLKACPQCEQDGKLKNLEDGSIVSIPEERLLRLKMYVELAQCLGFYNASLELLRCSQLQSWGRKDDLFIRAKAHLSTHAHVAPRIPAAEVRTFGSFVIYTINTATASGADLRPTDIHTIRWGIRTLNKDFVKWLLSKGANINAGGGRPICTAAEVGDDDMLHFLISHGADPRIGGAMAIRCVITGDQKQMAAKLIEHVVALVEGKSPEIHNRPLDPKKRRVVEILMQHGADINGMLGIPLGAAVESGNLEWVKLLVNQYGAKPHKRALWFAVLWGHLHVVKWLVENGADVNETYPLGPIGPPTILDGVLDPTSHSMLAGENVLMPIIHRTTSAGITAYLRSRGAKTSAELRAAQPATDDIAWTAPRDMIIVVAIVFYNSAEGTWYHILNLLLLFHLIRKWTSYFNVDIGFAPIWDQNIVAIERSLLFVGGIGYRYIHGKWINWDFGILAGFLFYTWLMREEDPAQGLLDFVAMNEGAQRPRPPGLSDRTKWWLTVLAQVLTFVVAYAMVRFSTNNWMAMMGKSILLAGAYTLLEMIIETGVGREVWKRIYDAL